MKISVISTLLYSILIFISSDVSGMKTGFQKIDSIPIRQSGRLIVSIDTAVHFFKHCMDLLESQAGLGHLQDVEGHPTFDSTGPFYSVACYHCKESYEVYFDLKGGFAERNTISEDSIWRLAGRGCQNLFSAFNCYAFVLPMRNPDEQDDEHAMNIDFPVIVKVYKRINLDNWRFVKKVHISTFSKYSRLIFNCIYGYD